jgi:dienelactone hydrolase
MERKRRSIFRKNFSISSRTTTTASYHGFSDSCARYDDAAAKLSWERTLTFFRKYLDGKGT